MASIYEITGDIKLIQQMIEDGVPEEAFAEALERFQGELSDKLDGYAMVIKNVQSDVDGIKAEEKRLAERRKQMEKNIERMQQAMSMALQTVEPDKDGKKRVKTEKFTFSFRSSSAVEVDESKISRYYMKPKYEVDKTAIKKILAIGGTVRGARLIENQSLQIN
ncbi:MAG: siphovirus Gp157 family protein [Kurthia sp.]